MKNRLYFILLLLAIFVPNISYCQSSDTSGVRIRYCNKTGYHLDSLTIDNQYFGRLEDETSTDFFRLDSIRLDGSYFSPTHLCAKIGTAYEKSCFDKKLYGICGTGLRWINRGTIIVDILIKTDVGEFDLYGKMTKPTK